MAKKLEVRKRRVKFMQSYIGDEHKCIRCENIRNRMNEEEIKWHISTKSCKNESGYESISPIADPGSTPTANQEFNYDFKMSYYRPEHEPESPCNWCNKLVSKKRILIHKYYCRFRKLQWIQPGYYRTAGKISMKLLKKKKCFLFGTVGSKAKSYRMIATFKRESELRFRCKTNANICFQIIFRQDGFLYNTDWKSNNDKTAAFRIPERLQSCVDFEYIIYFKCKDEVH